MQLSIRMKKYLDDKFFFFGKRFVVSKKRFIFAPRSGRITGKDDLSWSGTRCVTFRKSMRCVP